MNQIIPPVVVFTLDALVIAMLAWRSLCASGLNRHGLVETTLGWILLSLGWIVGAGVGLGAIGALGRWGFLEFHVLGLVAMAVFRRARPGDGKFAWAFLQDWSRFFSSRTPESVAVIAISMALGVLGFLAAQVDPAVFDALTYRLSKIGQWLQDGYIASYATDDPRINYMPVGPDLVITWLLGATREGFRLAPLSQLIGGVLVLVSTFGLARTAGLQRLASLGAVALVLGMANVAVQLTTIQSDLFTAGVFAAGYLLWHRALLRGESSWVGAVGVALAWGSKGTLFYLAPGAAIWVAWLIWQRRGAWRTLLPTAVVGMLASLLFVMPGYWRNLESYHSLFGPREAMKLHHGDPLTMGQHLEKLSLNLQTSAVQLFDPTAQPFWCEEALRTMGRKLLPYLPLEDDRYMFMHDYPRRTLADGILQQTETDADVASSGILAAVLFCFGTLYAGLRCREKNPQQIAVWGFGVVVYVIAQHFLVQWHQWAFRFALLAAPWMAVIGAWFISRFSPRWRLAVWLIVTISSVQVAVRAQWQAHQAAWQAFIRPQLGQPQYVYSRWRQWAEQLDATTAQTKLRLAMPINSPIAAFYRIDRVRPVTMEKRSELKVSSAEVAVAGTDSWLVVPALMFLGREGSVMGTTWLYAGDQAGINSLAAYRALRPGESPLPILYRSTHTFTPDGLQRQMLVRSWKPEVVFHLKNPDGVPWRFEVRSGTEQDDGILPPNGELDVTVKVSNQYVTAVEMDFQIDDTNRRAEVFPSAILMRP